MSGPVPTDEGQGFGYAQHSAGRLRVPTMSLFDISSVLPQLEALILQTERSDGIGLYSQKDIQGPSVMRLRWF